MNTKSYSKRELEALIAKIEAGTLTYEDTPELPLKFEYSHWRCGLTDEEKQEEEMWKLLYPYCKSKERTTQVMEIMNALDEKPDVEKLFSEYVKYYKNEDYYYNIDPFKKYWKIYDRAVSFKDEVDNVLEYQVRFNGRTSVESVINTFSERDRAIAKIALAVLLKDKNWVKEGETIISDHVSTSVEKPNVSGLKALEKLGLFQKLDNKKYARVPVTVHGGKLVVKLLDPERVSMFCGEVDISDLPHLDDGQYIWNLVGGDKIAFHNPDVVVTRNLGSEGTSITFKKYNVKKKKYVEGEYMTVLVTSCFNIQVDKPSKDDEDIPTPTIPFTKKFHIKSLDLKNMLVDGEGDVVFEDCVVFQASQKQVQVIRNPESKYDEDGKEVKPRVYITEVLSSANEQLATAIYACKYLNRLVDVTRPLDTIEFEFADEMPLKASFENKHIKGAFWLAPRIKD